MKYDGGNASDFVYSVETMVYFYSYSWTDSISERKLNIETSLIYPNGSKQKMYFICFGSFEGGVSKYFTILDQLWGQMKFKHTTIQDKQKMLVDC
jgi:hypothetical protein